MGAPEVGRGLLAHDVEGGGVGVGHGALMALSAVGDDGDAGQIAPGGGAGLGIQNVLVHRAVLSHEVALIAAGGDGKGIGQPQQAGVAAAVFRILNGHGPRLALRIHAADVDVAAQTDAAAGDAAAGEDGRHAVGGVALGDAAKVDGAARVQRDGGTVLMDMLRTHQRQQGVDLRLRGDVGGVGGDGPQLYQRGHGDIEGTIRLRAVLPRQRQQAGAVLAPDGAAVTVQTTDIAGVDGAGEGGLQRVDLL